MRNNLSPRGKTQAIKIRKNNKCNDVINDKYAGNIRTNAFHHLLLRIQLPSAVSHSKSTNQNSFNHSKLVAITTSTNPSKDTFRIPIKKRLRASNIIPYCLVLMPRFCMDKQNPYGSAQHYSKRLYSTANQTDIS